MHTTIFEVIMLLCFGAAWPFSIYKSYTTKTSKGQSLIFLLALLIGYVSGITNNIINGLNYVLFFYLLNLVMVSAEIGLYFRNIKYDKPKKVN